MGGLFELQINLAVDTLKFTLSPYVECWSAPHYYEYIGMWIASGLEAVFLLLSDREPESLAGLQCSVSILQ